MRILNKELLLECFHIKDLNGVSTSSSTGDPPQGVYIKGAGSTSLLNSTKLGQGLTRVEHDCYHRSLSVGFYQFTL